MTTPDDEQRALNKANQPEPTWEQALELIVFALIVGALFGVVVKALSR